jgi:hypothetical protein
VRERLLDAFLRTTWETCWGCDAGDLDVAEDRLNRSGIDKAIDFICAAKPLLALALNPATRITTDGMGTEVPLFRFDNGGDADVYADEWEGEVDFPIGVAMVVCGGCVASANPAPRSGPGLDGRFVRTAQLRRREVAYFKRLAQECPDRAFAEALDELADACGEEVKHEVGISHDLRRALFEVQMEHVLQQRGRVVVAGLRGRRLDRRLTCPRPRTRSTVRASSRGGDSGDPDLGDEPPGHRPPSPQGWRR